MDTLLLNILIGVIIGVITNFAVWALLFRALVPKIRFSPALSKVPIKKTLEDKSGYRYRFKIENAGWRNIIDIELMARLSIKGLRTPSIWVFVYIPLSPDGSRGYKIPKLFPAKKGKAARRKIMFLYTNSTDILRDWSIFPEEVRRKAKDKTLLLDDLMSLGSQSRLEIQAYGYDEFSGARKLFVSVPYRVQDIVVGTFDPRGMAVLEDEAPMTTSESTEAVEG